MGDVWTFLLLSLVHQSYMDDGCGSEGLLDLSPHINFMCGDTCVSDYCYCGGKWIDKDSGSWCCVREGERCEGQSLDGVGESNNQTIIPSSYKQGGKQERYINATCSSGVVLGLEEPCHGACNHFPGDPSPRSFLPCTTSATSEVTQCYKETNQDN